MTQVEPATHEFKGHLYYHPEEWQRYRGLDPYWTLAGIVINEADGYKEIETEIAGEQCRAHIRYSKSGLAPRPQDDVDGPLYEIDVHVEGDGERKCHFNISPRYPEMTVYETGETTSVPFDHLEADEGVTVQFQASNLHPDEIPQLLPSALDRLAESLGTSIRSTYFDQPQGGRIDELERYVRLTREINKKIIQKGGTLDRMAMLVSSEKGTKGEYKWDNVEEMGHHNQVRLCRRSVAELHPHHSRGRQIKSYLPQYPDRFEEGDPLYHPKFGVLFRKSLNDGTTVRWEDRHELVESLDETLLNVLSWSDIPIDVGDSGGSNTVFVQDDHFDVRARDEDIPIVENPLPRLESKQDHLLMTVLRDMTTSDTEIVETLATDGGQDVDDLAEETGYSPSTIYRALQRLEGVLENRKGHVRFVSEKIAEEIRAIIQSAEHAIASAADRAARLFDLDVVQSSTSAVDQWLARYGAEYIPEEDGPGRIRIDTMMAQIKSSPHPYLPPALDELEKAWLQDGRRHIPLDEIAIEVDLYLEGRVHGRLNTLR